MNESQRIADQISKALNGDAWHGPSWREILDGVGRDAAVHRPIPEAHSIADVVLHATTWHDVVRRRLQGETPEITDALDWPKASLADEPAWDLVRARLFESGKGLTEIVASFPEAKLLEKRPGVDGTWYELIIGELQHVLYHAGQAALLKKAHVPAAV
jgi:DinB superfamily